MKKYTKSMKHKGFTVVELLVVIVVIVILATITIATYAFVSDDAMDTKIKATVKVAGDAISLYEAKNNGELPASKGYFSNPNGVDSLVPTYLKTGYRDGLSSRNVNHSNQIFRWYTCSDGGFAVYASLNNPTAEDTANLNKIRTTCGTSTTHVPETGTLKYNYAQLF